MSLEGLRGIAAFIVVLTHLHNTFYATSSSDIRSSLAFMPYAVARTIEAAAASLYNGRFSVWLFWIMSAFVLSRQFFLRTHLTSGASSHDYLEDATLRRYPRLLLPVLASVMFAYVIDSLGFMNNVRLAHTLGEPYKSGWLASFYTFPPSALGAIKSGVWQTFFAYDPSSTYNSVLWTMQKESYGSIFLFAFLAVFGHRRSRFFAYPLITLLSIKLGLTWLDTFVAGIVLCDLSVNRNKLQLVQLALRWPIFNFVRHSRLLTALFWIVVIVGAGFGNIRGSYLVFGTAAVTLTLISPCTQRFLSSGIPVFLGKISFGVYLIHLPLICSFSSWAYLTSHSTLGEGAAPVVSVVTCGLSIFLGYLLYLVADRPGIRLSRWLSSLIMNPPRNAYQRSDSIGH